MQPADLRFWRKVQRTAACWLWTGRVDRGGYGAFSVSRQTIVRAHRHSWELANGAPPANACVLHRCGERRCVNPEHLFLGSAHQCNRPMAPVIQRAPRPSSPRGAGHWTHRQSAKVRRGARSNLSKLTAEAVREIRSLAAAGVAAEELAARHGVVVETISNIIHYRTWRDLSPTQLQA